MQHAFCLFLPLFCSTTTLFCRTKTSNFLVTHFYGGIVVCAYAILSPVFMFAFIFSAAHFHLAGHYHFSLSHGCFEFSCLSPYQIHLFCFQSLTLAVSQLSTWVETSKITSKKTQLCCCFFFLKVRVLMRFFPNKTLSSFGLPYLLMELFYIGMTVVQTDGRSVYGHVITKVSRMGSLPHVLTLGAPL